MDSPHQTHRYGRAGRLFRVCLFQRARFADHSYVDFIAHRAGIRHGVDGLQNE